MTNSTLENNYLSGDTIVSEFGLRGFSQCYLIKGNEKIRIRETQYERLLDKYADRSEFKMEFSGLTRHYYKIKHGIKHT